MRRSRGVAVGAGARAAGAGGGAVALLYLALCAALLAAEGLYDVTGQKCDFENSTNPGCGWLWKQTEHGFRVVTGQEIASLHMNVKGLSGPTMDANNNTQGEGRAGQGRAGQSCSPHAFTAEPSRAEPSKRYPRLTLRSQPIPRDPACIWIGPWVAAVAAKWIVPIAALV